MYELPVLRRLETLRDGAILVDLKAEKSLALLSTLAIADASQAPSFLAGLRLGRLARRKSTRKPEQCIE